MASVVDTAGKPGERHTGLIHSILARSEERLAATIDARAESLDDRLRRLEIMIQLFVQIYLGHTPEVPVERRPSAYAAISRRWKNYQAGVARRFAENEAAGAEAVDAGRSRPGRRRGAIDVIDGRKLVPDDADYRAATVAKRRSAIPGELAHNLHNWHETGG